MVWYAHIVTSVCLVQQNYAIVDCCLYQKMENSSNDSFIFAPLVPLNSNASKIFFPTETHAYLIALRVVVGATCTLSILGAGLIILTYLFFPDIRTLARQLLVMLSVADLIIAVANLTGVLTSSQYSHQHHTATDLSEETHRWCTVQAGFAVYGAESSTLWTIAVAVYMFVIIVFRKPKVARRVVPFFYLVCWGVPLVLTIWLGLAGFLGYEIGATPGFCAIRGTKSTSNSTSKTVVYPIIVGYDMWIYTAFVVLPILYTAIKCHVKVKLIRRSSGYISLTLQSVARTADRKLIFVPILFMVLRIWSIIVDIAVYYLPSEPSFEYRRSYASVVFGILEGIGDSGQGAANGILFIMFTQAVRQRLLNVVKCVYCQYYCTQRRTYEMNVEDDNIRDMDSGYVEDKDREETVSNNARRLLEFSSDQSDAQRYNSVDS